jgi:hypothetical protein
MKSRDFCYWLQGYFELYESSHQGPIGEVQAQRIRDHLKLVFKHEIDPSAGSAEHQAELNAIHAGEEPPMPPHIALKFQEEMDAKLEELRRTTGWRPGGGLGGGGLVRC